MLDATAARDAWRQFPCKIWTGSISGHGYGHYYVRGSKPPKWILVHREALERKLGRPIAPGLFALHHCDNPPCHEPEHLYEGTQAQNVQDMIAQGRNSRQVIPFLDYPEIWRLIAEGGASREELAARYGVHPRAISAIIRKNPDVARLKWLKGDPCAVPGCSEPLDRRQWCTLHYGRWIRTGTTDPRPRKGRAECSAEGCGKPAHAQDLCSKHYQRLYNTGTAELAEAPRGSGNRRNVRVRRVRRGKGDPSSCVWDCESGPYEWVNLTGDIDNPDDYASMCRTCRGRYTRAIATMTTGTTETTASAA